MSIARGGQGGRAGKTGSARKGAAAGSGGQGRKKLAGKGATPRAEDRTKRAKRADSPGALTRSRPAGPGGTRAGGRSEGGPGARGASDGRSEAEGRSEGGAGSRTGGRSQGGAPSRTGGRFDGAAGSRTGGRSAGAAGRYAGQGGGSARGPRQTERHERPAQPARSGRPTGTRADRGDAPETVVGKNPVVEALRARVPATALHLAQGTTADERIHEAVSLAGKAGIALLELTRQQMDRMTGGAMHQGLALTVPAYTYLTPAAMLERALAAQTPLLVALDGVTDPRNLGAVVRSAAAFGAQGVLVPERRAAGMTASAWRTSAGAAARLPVARCTNLARTLKDYREAGLFAIGLAGDGESSLDELELATSPLVIVVGSEGDGLGRLVREGCDLTARIPMAGGTESLNAGIAAAVALAEVARRRRAL